MSKSEAVKKELDHLTITATMYR